MNDAGEMKWCEHCAEFWPATPEFFFRTGRGKLRAECKACYLEARKSRLATSRGEAEWSDHRFKRGA